MDGKSEKKHAGKISRAELLVLGQLYPKLTVQSSEEFERTLYQRERGGEGGEQQD